MNKTPPPSPLPVNGEGESYHSPIYEFVPSAFEVDGVFYPAITHLIDGVFQYKIIVEQPFDNADDVVPYANQYAREEVDRAQAVMDATLERLKKGFIENHKRDRIKKLIESEPAWGQSDIVWPSARMRFGIGHGHDDDIFRMAGRWFPFTCL